MSAVRRSTTDLQERLKFFQSLIYEPFAAAALQEQHITSSFLRDDQIRSLELYKSRAIAVRSVLQTGKNVEGHPGLAHGGFLALLIDDMLGYAMEGIFTSKWMWSVTANLTIHFRKVVPAESKLEFYVGKVENETDRKVSLDLLVVSKNENGDTFIHCDATSLQIIPRSKL